MAAADVEALIRIVTDDESSILSAWLKLLVAGRSQTGRIREAELQVQAKKILGQLREAMEAGGDDTSSDSYANLRETLAEISRSRAIQGFTPTETAHFVFSLKEPLFDALNAKHSDDPKAMAATTWAAGKLIDRLGLHTMEVFQRSREEIIGRQSQEISELSTPVVRLWDGIVALPLIGTLDSSRTGVVMETLLQAIVDEKAEIAVIDITGVPTVDTLVAQHLLKTVAATRLMGADCIISGIRPAIAQTMVHLGIELNVISKATLADAFALALRRTGRAVTRAPTSAGAERA